MLTRLRLITLTYARRAIFRSQNDAFAQQLAERRAEQGQTVKKRARGSVPKGTKLPAGYQDRTQLRNSLEEDDTTQRVQALEESMRQGKIDQKTFEALRDEIVGGDVRNVHLVRGLDFKLLERVRRGEDVMAEPVEEKELEEPEVDPSHAADVDNELDALEVQDVAPQERTSEVKKGIMAPPPPPSASQQKRTRHEILKAFKASRASGAARPSPDIVPALPELGSRFRKIDGNKKAVSRIERDAQGREILITVGEDGRVKRKVRKVPARAEEASTLLQPDKDAMPLGHDVTMPTDIAAPTTTEDNEDIFADVGTDFNPLGSVTSDDDISDCEEKIRDKHSIRTTSDLMKTQVSDSDNHDPPRRDYFGTSASESETANSLSTSVNDPTIFATLKKAAAIAAKTTGCTETREHSHDEDATQMRGKDAERKARHQRMLARDDRDAVDLDLGFGGSRMGDGEDEDEVTGKGGKRTKLSTWNGLDGEVGAPARTDQTKKGSSSKKRKK